MHKKQIRRDCGLKTIPMEISEPVPCPQCGALGQDAEQQF